MTDDELTTIEARCRNARVGEQIATVVMRDPFPCGPMTTSAIGYPPRVSCTCEMQDIVYTGVPALVAEVRRLREENDSLQGLCSRLAAIAGRRHRLLIRGKAYMMGGSELRLDEILETIDAELREGMVSDD